METLIHALENGSPIEQQDAGRDLEELADPRALEALEHLAQTGELVAAFVAIDALTAIGEPAIETIFLMLEEPKRHFSGPDDSRHFFDAALQSLATIDHPRAAQQLIGVVTTNRRRYCEKRHCPIIAQAGERLVEPAARALESMKSDEQKSLINLLTLIPGSAAACDCLIRWWERDPSLFNADEVWRLSRFGDPRLVKMLTEMQQHDRLKESATSALKDLLQSEEPPKPETIATKQVSVALLLAELDKPVGRIYATNLLENRQAMTLAADPQNALPVLLRCAAEDEDDLAKVAVPIIAKIVRDSVAELSTPQLRLLAVLQASGTNEYGLPTSSWSDLTTVTDVYEVDCSRIRHGARRELERRGIDHTTTA